MSDIVLSKGIRSNLMQLQNTAANVALTQGRLATGKKVNSALDNPANFFTSQSLSSRANDLSNLLDGLSNGIKVLEAADNGLKAITKTVESVEYRHIKQSGGSGQFAVVKITLEPNPGKGYEFVDKITGGRIPREYINPTNQGIQSALDSGVLAGYPTVDVKASLVDGQYHDVDSSEMAFKIAGQMAFKKAAEMAKPVLLEPIMGVEVVTPEEYMGDVMGDLSSRRGRIEGMEARGNTQVVRAQVPLSEMFGYSTDLRSRTQGRATYTMQFAQYMEVPNAIATDIIKRVRGE